jgi:hypothetical protein
MSMSQEFARPPAQITGASKLIDLYGYYDPFHDAIVERITIERLGPIITIEFETCEMVCIDGVEGNPDQRAVVTIRWFEVEEMSLQGVDPTQNNRINGLNFSARGTGLETVIELMDGLYGSILARRAEVLEVVPL